MLYSNTTYLVCDDVSAAWQSQLLIRALLKMPVEFIRRVILVSIEVDQIAEFNGKRVVSVELMQRIPEAYRPTFLTMPIPIGRHSNGEDWLWDKRVPGVPKYSDTPQQNIDLLFLNDGDALGPPVPESEKFDTFPAPPKNSLRSIIEKQLTEYRGIMTKPRQFDGMSLEAKAASSDLGVLRTGVVESDGFLSAVNSDGT